MRACLALPWIAAASMACAGPEATPCPGVVDDYAVWNALLAERGNTVVVNETLSAEYIQFGSFAEQGLASNEAMLDLLVRSDVSMALDESQFDVAGELHLLPYADVPTAYDRRERPWENFVYRYETGIALSFSRPGFGCGEAVVYVLSECGQLCATGRFYVLAVNEDGEWVVFRQYQSWIS